MQFLIVAVGGVVCGLIVGGAAIALAGRTSDHLVETALTAVAAWGSFLLAEHFGASGVLATVAAGMTMGNLGVLASRGPNLKFTPRGRAFAFNFWEFAAFVANSYTFLMIGVALADVRSLFSFGFAFMVLLALAGRAAAVYPLSLAFRNTRWRLELAEQHFLWWAGLRGALALALALSLPPGMAYRGEILVGAFGVVAFSTLVQGLTAGLVLRALGLDRKSEH